MKTKTPHKHAELIKAWADGAEIQWYDNFDNVWNDCGRHFDWGATCLFRIKPEPKPDVVQLRSVSHLALKETYKHNLKLTFDGETGKLKSAEVL